MREREKEIFKKSRNDIALEGAGGVCVYVCACVLGRFSHVWLSATLWTIACQASLSMGFSGQEYSSGLPCPSPRHLPKPGVKLLCLSFVHWFSSVQLLSHVQLFATPWTAACQDSLSQTHVHWVSDDIQPAHLLPSPSPPAFYLSQHQGFFPMSVLRIRWPKYWSFSFSISPSNEYSGLISFRIDWFGLLAVQGTLKSLFQHFSWKPSILWHSVFFIETELNWAPPGKKVIGLFFLKKHEMYQSMCWWW